MMKRWIPGLAAGLLAAGAAAQTPQDMLQIEAPPAWRGGWTMTSEHGGPTWRFTAYKPEGAPPSPRDFITVSSTWGGSQKDGVSRMIGSWGEKVRGACPGATAVPPKPRSQNGYTVGYAQFYCPRRPGSNEGTADFVKAIASEGTAHLVVVSRITRRFISETPGHIEFEDEADQKALVAWINATGEYLVSVRSCNGPSPLQLTCSPP